VNTKRISLDNKKVLLILIIVLLAIVIYAGNVIRINTSRITDILCLGAFTFLPISGIVCAICFLIPLHSGITGLYIYGYAVLMILFKSKNIKLKIFFPLLIIAVYEIVMMLFANANQINYIVVYALTIFLLLYIMNSEEISPKESCISYICGTFVLLACIFTTAVQNHSLEMVLSGAVRIGDYEGLENLSHVAIVTENANAMAYYALVAVFIAFSMMKTVKLFGKILLSAAILFSTVIALFTVSRTFVIVMLILLLFALLSNFSFKDKLKFLLIIALVAVMVVPYLQQKTQIFDALTERFEDENLATGTGRVDIFLEYMKFLLDNPLRLFFGTGAVFYQKVCNLGHSMHNGLQQILVSYGVLGFVPMIGVLISPIFDFFKNHKFKLAKFLPVLAVILFTQTIQFLNPNNLMLPYAVAILCMKIPDTEVAQ